MRSVSGAVDVLVGTCGLALPAAAQLALRTALALALRTLRGTGWVDVGWVTRGRFEERIIEEGMIEIGMIERREGMWNGGGGEGRKGRGKGGEEGRKIEHEVRLWMNDWVGKKM